MRRLILLSLLLSSLVLCACGRSAPTSYYVLESAAPEMASGPLPSTSLRVAPVTVPQYHEKVGLIRNGSTPVSISVSDTQQWAESLPEGIRRVVQAEMAEPLRQKKIHVLANADESDSDYSLFIHVERLDFVGADTVRLTAQWRCEKANRILAQGVFSDSEKVRDDSAQAQVQAQSALVRRMAAWILEQLPKLGK